MHRWKLDYHKNTHQYLDAYNGRVEVEAWFADRKTRVEVSHVGALAQFCVFITYERVLKLIKAAQTLSKTAVRLIFIWKNLLFIFVY